MAQYTLQKRDLTVKYFTEDLGNGVGLDMILIPAGSFLRGSPEDELERGDEEGPQQEVTVPRFLMGRYPITQAQCRVVAAMEPVERDLKSNPSRFKGEDHPVERVTWNDAVEFCQRLSRHTRRSYRLPSEAEWEYACRAGTTTPFYYGKTLTPELANYACDYSYDDGPTGERIGQTSPVGQFPPNAFGLSDMHGNVLEWCQDHYHDFYEGAPTDGSAWVEENSDNQLYILRGGAWCDFPWSCRSACRDWVVPGNDHFNVGFRVVCVAPT